MILSLLLTSVMAASLRPPGPSSEEGSDLRVSGSGRYLVRSDGSPFFWMGDTAWQLFVKLSKSEATLYLRDRANRGFTVIQAGIITWDGNIPNAYGIPAFGGTDVSQPNEAFFQNVDAAIDLAAQEGLHLGLLPLFVGSKSSRWLVDETTAYNYGQWLGNRYKSRRNIIWILGGDLAGDYGGLTDIWRALAKGIAVGVTGTEDYSKTIMTYHPCGSPCASSTWFQNEAWLSFNMSQSHESPSSIYSLINSDYNLPIVKPTGIGEGWYESSNPSSGSLGGTAVNIRRESYWSFLAGGYYTYGNDPIYWFGSGWEHSLNTPGAQDMTIYKNLLTSRQWWKFVPDQSIFASGAGSDDTLNAAARSTDGDSIIVYLSSPSTISINMDKITASGTVSAHWFDPASGLQAPIGTYPNTGTQSFASPSEWVDAVLLLDATWLP
jgi:Protein of unknown function (DUF4038)/Putative collagen-binding domain of a collagenase